MQKVIIEFGQEQAVANKEFLKAIKNFNEQNKIEKKTEEVASETIYVENGIAQIPFVEGALFFLDNMAWPTSQDANPEQGTELILDNGVMHEICVLIVVDGMEQIIAEIPVWGGIKEARFDIEDFLLEN